VNLSVVADIHVSSVATEEIAIGRSQGIDSGVVGQRASLSPADHTALVPFAVRALVHQWSARVTLAGVLALLSGTAHGGINSGGAILSFACDVANNRNGDLHQLLADLATRAQRSPASGDHRFARLGKMVVAVRWHAYTTDPAGLGVDDRIGQLHKGDVVGIGTRVVSWVHDDLRNRQCHLSCFILIQEVAACKEAEAPSLSAVSIDAMGGRNDPLVINNGPATSLSGGRAGGVDVSGHAHRYLPAPAVGNRR